MRPYVPLVLATLLGVGCASPMEPEPAYGCVAEMEAVLAERGAPIEIITEWAPGNTKPGAYFERWIYPFPPIVEVFVWYLGEPGCYLHESVGQLP